MSTQSIEPTSSFSGRAKALLLGALGIGACGLCCAGPILAAIGGTGALSAVLACNENLVGLAAALALGIGGYALWRRYKRTCSIAAR